jgi:hypothetical protein
MASVTLIHPEKTFTVPVVQATNKCSLFQHTPTLLTSPYRVQSSVTLSDFQDFLSALKGNAIKITDTNLTGLERLCGEFGFSEFAGKLSEFRPSTSFEKSEDADARGRIAALEEKANQQNRAIVVLQDKLKQLSTDFGRLTGEVSTLRSVAAEVRTLSDEFSGLKEQIAAGLREGFAEQLSTKFDDVRREVSALKALIAGLDSRIISDFPEIFAEFRKFSLLWRGGRDGFKAKEFHHRCDRHANTLTVILDTKGNIFGGFTPVEWDRNSGSKADDSLKSFLFTLKNPHNIPARRFALKAEKKQRAILCCSEMGPCFGDPCDMAVRDNCNADTWSDTSLGWCYTNDTGLSMFVVFTGSDNFQVKEIEVFGITD